MTGGPKTKEGDRVCDLGTQAGELGTKPGLKEEENINCVERLTRPQLASTELLL